MPVPVGIRRSPAVHPGRDQPGLCQRGGRIAVDLQEKRQLDLAKQVASVKARTRPWRAIIFSLLAVIAAGVSYAFGRHLKNLFEALRGLVSVRATGRGSHHQEPQGL
jgi:hypothetical protein